MCVQYHQAWPSLPIVALGWLTNHQMQIPQGGILQGERMVLLPRVLFLFGDNPLFLACALNKRFPIFWLINVHDGDEDPICMYADYVIYDVTLCTLSTQYISEFICKQSILSRTCLHHLDIKHIHMNKHIHNHQDKYKIHVSKQHNNMFVFLCCEFNKFTNIDFVIL